MKKIKYLAIITGFILIISMFIFYLVDSKRTISETETKIALISKRLLSLEKMKVSLDEFVRERDRIEKEIKMEVSRYYSQDDSDIYVFGIMVRKIILKNNLEIKKYHTFVENSREMIEFSVTGDIISIIMFIKEIYENEKYIDINYLRLKRSTLKNHGELIFRISYETLS